MARTVNVASLATAILDGDRTALSRGITLIESNRHDHRLQALELLESLDSKNKGKSLRIGITGSPGAGKSTFIEALGNCLIEQGHKVAVLAIDPSSSRTKGSILGDKTRMQTLTLNTNAYIRPSPAGKTLGGVTSSTFQAIQLCEAAGYDRIIVETVGVGQSEHTVSKLTDLVCLLVLPGSGDDLQGIKRGIVEVADLILINKSDGSRKDIARQTASDYRRAVHLQPAREDGWSIKVGNISSIDKEGIKPMIKLMDEYVMCLNEEGLLQRRQSQAREWFDQFWPDLTIERLKNETNTKSLLKTLQAQMQEGKLSSTEAVNQFFSHLDKHFKL